MQPSVFNPWAWRDPSAPGWRAHALHSLGHPPDGQEGGHDGPDAPGSVDDLEYRERIGNYYADSYAPPQVM
ncbi:hypothetical protein [Micromonospora chokoriensis]|uniref:hypothetical protein n=1 Tax=Micromonospora chokoriensis TaxID=356851 RepID=UPI0004C36ECA|nr:hypothetical protein [Micromonospora chokoriensis]